MLRCKNCGKVNIKGRTCCSRCGFVLDCPETPQRKKLSPRSKKIVIIAAAAVLVVLISGVLLPVQGAFRKKHRNLVSVPMQDIAAVLADVLCNPQLELTCDVDITAEVDKGGDMLNELLSGTVLNVSADADMPHDRLGIRATLFRNGEKTLNAGFLYEDGRGNLYVPELDADRYSFSCSRLNEATDGKIGRYLGIYLDTGSLFPDLDDGKTKNMIERYSDLLISRANSGNVTRRFKELQLSVSEKPVGCALYTYTPSRDDIFAMFDELCETLSADEYAKSYFCALYVSKLMVDGVDRQEAFTRFEGQWNSFLHKLKSNVEPLSQSLADGGFSIKTGVRANRVYYYELSALGDSCPIYIRYESAGKTSKSRADSMTVRIPGSEFTLLNSYKRQDKTVDGSLEFRGSGIFEDVGDVYLSYSCNPLDGSRLYVPYGNYTLIRNGRISALAVSSYDGKDRLELETVLFGADTKITVDVNSTFAVIPSVFVRAKDIDGLETEEFARIFKNIKNEFFINLFEQVHI